MHSDSHNECEPDKIERTVRNEPRMTNPPLISNVHRKVVLLHETLDRSRSHSPNTGSDRRLVHYNLNDVLLITS